MSSEKIRMKSKQGFTILGEEKHCIDVRENLFPELDETFEFDLESEIDEAIDFNSGGFSSNSDIGIIFKNFDSPDKDIKTKIARKIKSFGEMRSRASGETIVLISGTESLSQYEPDLSGRVYNMR